MKPDKSKHACTLMLAADRQNSVLQSHRVVAPEFAAYTPYGYRHLLRERSISLGFSGCLTESMTGWILLGNGYRAYSTALMRFFSPDNWSPFGKGGFNAYGYCGGDPINRVDPSGHMRIGVQSARPQRLFINPARRKIIPFRPGPGIKYSHHEGGNYIGGGVAASWSVHKEKWTLNVQLHGVEAGGQVLGAGLGKASASIYGVEDIAAMIQKSPRVIEAAFRIKLIMCHGGEYGVDAFGARLARALGRPVKAYIGKVFGSELIPEGNFMYSQFPINKDNGLNYRSIYFDKNGRVMRPKHTIIDMGD